MDQVSGSSRADSRRYRARLLEAANSVFGEKGAAASTEDVALRAGVGIGTLVRHFPTREALLEATVLARLERLVEAARTVLAESRPDGFFALFGLFLAEAQDKRALGEAVAAAGEAFRTAHSAILDELWAIYSTLILRGQAAGLIRPGFDADDVRALLAGAHQALLVVGDNPGRRQRLLDMLTDGVRIPAG